MRYALALFIVFLSLSVGALEYSATTKLAQMQLCACGTYSNIIEVANLDTTAAEFLITNPSPAWVQTTPSKLILQPKTKTKVTNLLTVPCGLQGEFELRNRIFAGSAQKELSQSISVQKCPNTQVALPSETLQACACDPKEFVLEISNIGSFTEEYLLNSSPYTARFSENPVVIAPHTKKNVSVVFDISCAASGEQTLNIIFYAKRNDILSKVPLSFAVSSCGTLDLHPQDVSVCAGVRSSLVVPFTYEGKPSVLEFQADVPWIQGEIVPSTKKEARLSLLSDVSGAFDVHIVAKRQNLSLAQSVVSVIASPCYQVLAQVPKINACGQTDAQAILRNTGTQALDLSVDVAGLLWMQAPKGVSLAANGTKTLSLRVSPQGIPVGTYTGELLFSSEQGYRTNASFSIYVPSDEECSLVDISAASELVTSGHKQIPLLVENKGFVRQEYRFALEGSDWLRLFPEILNLAPQEQGVLYLETSPSADALRGDYRFQIHATIEDDIRFSKTFLISLDDDPLPLWSWVVMGCGIAFLILLYVFLRKKSFVSIELVRDEEQQPLRHPYLSWSFVSLAGFLLVSGAYVAYKKTALAQGIVGRYLFGYLSFVIIVVLLLALLIWYLESPVKKESSVIMQRKEPVPPQQKKEPVETWKQEGLLSPATSSSSIVNNFDALEKKEARRREGNRRKHAAKEKPYAEKVQEHEKKRQK